MDGECKDAPIDTARHPVTTGAPLVCTKKIGQGSFGQVYLAVNQRNGKEYAVKIINKDKGASGDQSFSRESKSLSHLKHENILQMHYCSQSSPRAYKLVLDLCTGGTLTQKVHSLKVRSERFVWNVMRQIVGAVAHMHQEGYIHRDIKPSNVMFRNQTESSAIVLTDFGACIKTTERQKDIIGTVLYMAPELFGGRGTSPFTTAIDDWALGGVMYYCSVGKEIIYLDHNEREKFLRQPGHATQELKKVIKNMKLPPELSASGVSFMKKFLSTDVKERMKSQEALSYQWLSIIPDENVFSNRMVTPEPESPSILFLRALIGGISPGYSLAAVPYSFF